MYDGFKYTRITPACLLLVDRRLRRQVMRQVTPLAACVAQVAQAIEQGPQRVLPLRRIFPHQAQVRGHKRSFTIRDIAWVTAGWCHDSNLASSAEQALVNGKGCHYAHQPRKSP